MLAEIDLLFSSGRHLGAITMLAYLRKPTTGAPRPVVEQDWQAEPEPEENRRTGETTVQRQESPWRVSITPEPLF
jgi:hypothetical protein